MKNHLPAAKSRKRMLIIVGMVGVLILSAVCITTFEIFNTVLEGQKQAVSNHLVLFKSMLESQKIKDPKKFAADLFLAYETSINKIPEGVIEYGLVRKVNGRLVVLITGRGDPKRKRDPKYGYLIDEKGNPFFWPDEHEFAKVMNLALEGKSGVANMASSTRGEFVVAYAPLVLEDLRLGLAVGIPLGPIRKAMLDQSLVILAFSVVFIAVGAWIFLRLNPMLAELSHSQEVNIRMLGEASHYKDTDTGWHVERMADYSVAIAQAMGLPKEKIKMLGLAARMHDLGKVGTPDNVLKKPAKLDDKEWQIMREHSKVGATIMNYGDSPLFEMAKEIAQGHHEKWDGTGYPEKKKGQDIPIMARITAVADVFDALTMKRPYKEAWPMEKAFSLIKEESGKHFDPHVVDAFLSVKNQIVTIKDNWDQKEAQSLAKEDQQSD